MEARFRPVTKRVTIEKIKRALAGPNAEEMIESLRSDPRKGVQKLILSWEKKRAKEHKRQERTKALYYMVENAWKRGYRFVAGIDEAGRGPLAGPVVAASVVLCQDERLPVEDSKKLSAKERDLLYEEIIQKSLAYGVGIVSADEIARRIGVIRV